MTQAEGASAPVSAVIAGPLSRPIDETQSDAAHDRAEGDITFSLFLAALSPLLAVLLLLVGLRMPALRAMALAYLVTVAAGYFLWQMAPRTILAASIEGLAIAASV
ncbi:MAG: hypothetical protein ABJI59_25000, partial [Nisaea sp.]